jgi:hypothetical protein
MFWNRLKPSLAFSRYTAPNRRLGCSQRNSPSGFSKQRVGRTSLQGLWHQACGRRRQHHRNVAVPRM